jgi:PAS domain S-box-containing protein
MGRRKNPAGDEVDDLRARLQEAEQTLDAIRSGSVDALVIAGPHGDRVFTLEGADYRYRRLVETMKEGAAILAADGAIVYANDRLAEMFGCTLARIIGSNVDAHVATGSLRALQALLREGMSQPSKTEVSFVRGVIEVPTYVSATPTGDSDGGVCIVVTDLTEQKRSEDILAAERLATSILEQAAEAVVVCNVQGRIVRTSRAALQLAGEEPLFRAFGQVFPIRMREGGSHHDLLARALAGEVVSGAEATLARAESTKHLVVSAAPLADAQHAIIGCVVSLTDVTERKRAEDGMQLLGLASAALGGSWNVAAMVERLVGVIVPAFADWCVVYTLDDDRHAVEIAGVRHVDSVSTPFVRRELTAAARAANGTLVEAILSDVGARRIAPFETDPIDAFTAPLCALGARSVLMAPMRAHRRAFGVIVVGRSAPDDAFREESLALLQELAVRTAVAIDSSKLFDLAHREKERAEEANRAKDEFLAVVSHELRTPLNAILGWARILRSRELARDQRDQAMETIERNAMMQTQLIDDLLDISRIVSGKLRLERGDVDVVAVVRAAMDSVRPLVQAKDISVQAAFDLCDAPVLGDAARLQQVVWNLLTNAVKFTNRGGHVDVSLRSAASHVEITVQDDGKGIAKEFLPRVFERFLQADGGSARSHGGLGLGLAIVKNIVELHGGAITAHSDGEGRGARFVVTLPCASAVRAHGDTIGANERPAFQPADQLAGARLLVVDDDTDGREFVATLLRGCNAQVETAESGASAFELLQRERFDALLSDISMPGEDGYSLIGRVRALPPEKNGRIPAVALTALARSEDRRRALVAGYDGHIPKPIEPQELMLVLLNMIHREA